MKLARVLDQVASIPGTTGVLLTVDHCVAGAEKFGRRIQPKPKRSAHLRSA